MRKRTKVGLIILTASLVIGGGLLAYEIKTLADKVEDSYSKISQTAKNKKDFAPISSRRIR